MCFSFKTIKLYYYRILFGCIIIYLPNYIFFS